MNKKQFVKELSKETALTRQESGKVLDAVLGIISRELSKEGEVSIADFGKFTSRHVPERDARNPLTGETVTVKAHKAAHFKAFGGIFAYAHKH